MATDEFGVLSRKQKMELRRSELYKQLVMTPKSDIGYKHIVAELDGIRRELMAGAEKENK